jgi:DNA-binding MarR family transcriptional regulator
VECVSQFEHEDVVRLRAALGRISRQLDRNVSSGGMTRTQLSILATIAFRGPIGSGELAEIEGMNPTMLSRILTKLETTGLVVRTPDPNDGRAVRVAITKAGQRSQERLRDERARLLADRLERLPSTRTNDLLAALPALEELAVEMSREAARA